MRTLLRPVLAGLVLVLGGVGDEAGGGCLSLQLILELSSSSGDDGRVSGSRLLMVLSKSSYVLKLRMAKPSMTSSSKTGSLFLFLRFGGLGGFAGERPGDSSPSSALWPQRSACFCIRAALSRRRQREPRTLASPSMATDNAAAAAAAAESTAAPPAAHRQAHPHDG